MVEEGTTRGGAKGLGQWLARIAPKRARGSVTVAILPDTRVRALNRKYRGSRPVGSGIGLALAHGLVTRLGGTLVAGPAPEGGAAFTIVLPAT